MLDAVFLLILIVLIIVLFLWWILRKPVVELTLTVSTDKSNYFKEETVEISGSLSSGGTGLPGETVGIGIQPPTGDAYSLSAVTDGNGDYLLSWVVPSDAVLGQHDVTVGSLGEEATTAFTLGIHQSKDIGLGFAFPAFLDQLLNQLQVSAVASVAESGAGTRVLSEVHGVDVVGVEAVTEINPWLVEYRSDVYSLHFPTHYISCLNLGYFQVVF